MKEVFVCPTLILKKFKRKVLPITQSIFTNPKYTNLSNDAKITWSILRDRLDLSIRNNWIDKNGDIFLFTPMKNLNLF